MLRRASVRDGKTVVLKAIKAQNHEVAIHKALLEISSSFNHTIPIFDEAAFEFGTVIVLPQATDLRDAATAHNCQSLAKQFLEGVAFMHQNLFAHLDLKPANTVVDERSNHLWIIDFGTTVKLKTMDSTVTGYRGTEGWTAPEVGWHNDRPNETFRPIQADLWACGKVLEWFLERWPKYSASHMECSDLARRLKNDDPTARPTMLLPVDF